MKELFKTLIVDFHENIPLNVVKRDIAIPLDLNKAVSLIGIRRSGKTHIFFATINELIKKIPINRIVYLNFEDDRLFKIELTHMNLMLEAYYELYPANKNNTVYFFFDEIQNVNQWELFIRRVIDTEKCHIFITGSSSKLLIKEIATSLRGRSISMEVFPLSFKEFLVFKGVSSNYHSSKNKALIVNNFHEYLLRGGFPEVINYEPMIYQKTLAEYFDLVVFKDIIERYNIANSYLIKHFLKYCYCNMSSLLSVNKLYNDFKSQGLHLAKNTLYEYLGYLEDCYAIGTIPKYSESYREQMRNPRKIYGIDTGFKRLVDISFKEDIGRLYENIVFWELRRGQTEIYYYKDKTETDFFIPSKQLLINVSFSLSDQGTLNREIRSLKESMQALKIQESWLLTSDREEVIAVDNLTINVYPLWKWLLNKGELS